MVRTVLCFGDSNTHGSMPVLELKRSLRHPDHQRWPTIMAGQLGDTWKVITEGHPGRTTVHDDPIEGEHRNGARMLLATLESHRPIDAVILMLGTNDLKARFSVSAKEIALGVEKLVAIIRSSACGPDQGIPKILVVTPPPILETGVLSDFFRGGAAKSDAFAQSYEEMGKRAQVTVFDAGSVCAVSPADGIHFEPNALQALGEALADQLQKLAE